MYTPKPRKQPTPSPGRPGHYAAAPERLGARRNLSGKLPGHYRRGSVGAACWMNMGSRAGYEAAAVKSEIIQQHC
eukprot:1140892-Pelagomonas_calceolata.AAC.11